jgi:hypothetical protein
VLQLFPDIELAVQILVSSILSPKDMVKTEIIYKSKEAIMNAELLLKMNDITAANFETYHKTKETLTTVLREVLFTTGSYVNVVLPENVVDEIINNNRSISTESMSSLFTIDSNKKAKLVNLGILGSTEKTEGVFNISTENYDPTLRISSETNKTDKIVDFRIEVTDNIHLLKLPKIKSSGIKKFIKNTVSRKKALATESRSNLNNHEFTTIAYKGSQANTELFLSVPSSINAKRKSIGRPLVMRLPSESVIPVFIPGNETKHVGYFVAIDMEGNPVTAESNQQYIGGLNNLMSGQNNTQQGLSGLLIDKAKNNLSTTESSIQLDRIMSVYSNIIETDLVQRLKNGIYSTETSIGGSEEIYRIMLARSLANKYTRLLYIPAEYVTYFAFKYYPNGIGKSYLDDVKVLTSLRAILLFAKVMAQTKNAINITHVNMTLDPNDPDPQKTIEASIHEIVKMRQNYFPLGINTAPDLVNWIQRAGFEFSFEGHPGLPQTKFDFETKNMQHTIPDSDLDELLRKQTYMAFGLTPEVIDQGFNVEFATTIVSNNILLSKRVLQLQTLFVQLVSEWCVKLIGNDTVARQQYKELLKENKAIVLKSLMDDEKQAFTENEEEFYEDLIDRYLENLQIDLPKPDETSLKTQVDAFDEYIEALDKAIDYWISSSILTNDVSGEVNSNIDSIKAVLKAYFVRKWMSENNFMPELADIVTCNEDGNPNIDLFEINKDHIESIGKSVLTFIKKMKSFKEAANKDIENMNVVPGETTSSASTDDGGGSDSMGSDDFGMDEGGSLDDGSAGDVKPEEELPNNTTSDKEPEQPTE